MSVHGEIKPRSLTNIEKFELKFRIPYEFYINFGYTFYLIPDFTANKVEIAFDWLWIHIGMIHHSCGKNIF